MSVLRHVYPLFDVKKWRDLHITSVLLPPKVDYPEAFFSQTSKQNKTKQNAVNHHILCTRSYFASLRDSPKWKWTSFIFFFLLLLSFFLFRNPTGHQTRLINGRKALTTTFLVPLYRRGDTSQSVAVSGWYTTCGDGVQGIHEPRTVACSICCIVGHHEAGSFGLLARASCKSWSFKNTGANGPSVYT